MRGPRAGRALGGVRPARAAPGVRARGPRLAGAAGAVHGRARAALRAARAPAQARARSRARWGSTSRSSTARSPTPRPARASSARCSRGCARTRRRSRTALARTRPARPRRVRAGGTDGGRSLRGARKRRPDVSGLPDEPGVYIFRNASGQPLYVGKSVTLRTRARAHFAPSSASTDWAMQAELVDHRATRSELGALLLERRLIRELRPPGNVRIKHEDRFVYLRCRFDIAFPVLEVAPQPAAGHAREHRPAARAPPRGRARRAAQLAVRPAPLRAQAAAARASVGLRADGALPVAVPGRPRPERLPRPARRGARAVHRRRRRRGRRARARRRADARGRA